MLESIANDDTCEQKELPVKRDGCGAKNVNQPEYNL